MLSSLQNFFFCPVITSRNVTAILQELDILLEEAAKSGVQPVVGLRAKLATRHGGHWGTTSGENAKFGLSPRDIVAVVKKLAAVGMADCLQLLHFHIGSQVVLLRKRHPICILVGRRIPATSWYYTSSMLSVRCGDTDMASRRLYLDKYESKCCR